MTKETLKQTLEALEKLVDSFADVSAYEDDEHAFTNELIFIPDIKKAIKAIAAAKQALALPVQLVSWTGNGSAERRDIEAPTGYFFQVDRRTQPDERNFCSRCGKRTATADLVTIHTCTPPRGNA
jgi:hypothetical protein